MTDYMNRKTVSGFTTKLWRGERMTLLGFDVEQPEDDLAGFSIEVKSPGALDYVPLRNRLAFSYDAPVAAAVNGDRQFNSTEAPFQKFRWLHFPYHPKDGTYSYRVGKRHMLQDGTLKTGTEFSLDIEYTGVTHPDWVDIGFTRNFASSQAYREQFQNNADIIPKSADVGLEFKKSKLKNATGDGVYEWLGFEAYTLLFKFLEDTLDDTSLTLDVMAYDFNEPDLLALLRKFGNRLRVIVDDSSTKNKKTGEIEGHFLPTSAESKAAAVLMNSAGPNNVKRTHFQKLQHNKLFIARRNNVPQRVLCGSTNFTFRGLYIQANNVLVFDTPLVSEVFGQMFDLAFANPANFKKTDFSKKWHVVSAPGKPTIQVCFSPHASSDLSLNPIRGAIDQAASSVIYSVAFLNLIKSGPSYEAFKRLMTRPVFSFGTVDMAGKAMELRKPDGTIGLVDFNYLSNKAPEPFKSEWSGEKGRNVHHKFVVTDFSLPTAKVFTGSSNFAPSGEQGNGDQLIMIEDGKIATAYALEGLRLFDHLQFRKKMQDAKTGAAKKAGPLTLRRPKSITGKPAWFENYLKADSQAFRDRKIFST